MSIVPQEPPEAVCEEGPVRIPVIPEPFLTKDERDGDVHDFPRDLPSKKEKERVAIKEREKKKGDETFTMEKKKQMSNMFASGITQSIHHIRCSTFVLCDPPITVCALTIQSQGMVCLPPRRL